MTSPFCSPNDAQAYAPEVAWGVLRPIWTELTARFAAKSMPEPSLVTKVTIDPKWHDSCRHFAAVAADGSEAFFAPQLIDMPMATIVAIMAHECGHIVDLRNPGIYWYRLAPATASAMRTMMQILVAVPPEELASTPVLMQMLTRPKRPERVLKLWDDRSRDEVENVADKLAESVLGRKIGYVGGETCLVQAVGKGKPRPVGLR